MAMVVERKKGRRQHARDRTRTVERPGAQPLPANFTSRNLESITAADESKDFRSKRGPICAL